ncbi:MAG: GAF domain-containing protein [Actinobacteria bacterium]|nr:GAF domain-containing protein [Actinomycetota bacterium]
MSGGRLTLRDLDRCFGGAIPMVMATASADGTPNVTYLSRAHKVDDERIAISNQFMSKTSRNLAANPRASVLLMDPITHDEYRISLVYERTERRGHVFERLRTDIDVLASLTGMQDVFRLRAADIFRVVDIRELPPNPTGSYVPPPPPRDPVGDLAAMAEISARIARAGDVDVIVDVALDALDQLLGYSHSILLLVDEEGRTLYSIGARGFASDSVGAEVALGEGLVGMAAARCLPMRAGHLGQMTKYSNSMRSGYEGSVHAGREVSLPVLNGAQSRLAVPAVTAGELVGVLVVDSVDPVAFGPSDEHLLSIVASQLAAAIEHERALESDDGPTRPSSPAPPRSQGPPGAGPAGPELVFRFFPVDGSVFLGPDYVIKGVAGRILWSLLRHHASDGRVDFTNKELRLDPTLEMPGFKDNLESRLILLKRRLDEHEAPVKIGKTGRGRFRLHVAGTLRLETTDP